MHIYKSAILQILNFITGGNSNATFPENIKK